MNVIEITNVVREAQRLLVGGVVVRVREPMPHHLAIEIRKDGKNHELLIGVVAQMARIHLATQLPPTPPNPSPFALRARKLMRPARVISLIQRSKDRVVTLVVSQNRDQDIGWRTSLVAELFGSGRMFLLDEEDRVLAWSGQGGHRDLAAGDRYAPPPAAPRDAQVPADAALTSEVLEARYRQWAEQSKKVVLKRHQESFVAQERRRVARRVKAIERDLEKLSGWELWSRDAELLAAHRHLLERGMESVTVEDWLTEGSPQRVIPLEPDTDPEKQIDALFKRARKARAAIPRVRERLEAEREALKALEETRPENVTLAPRAVPERPGKPKQDKGIRRFRSSDGWQICVGRSAGENDHLTFRVARGNDFWFHARDIGGSHVLLRGDGEPPQRAVHEAALLAAHYSRLKDEGGGEVMYTQRKYLKRPKGGKPGQVLVTQEKVIRVALEDDAVRRLLETRAPS